MSLAAELRAVQERVAGRLAELEPLVAEYHDLLAARLRELQPLVSEYDELKQLAARMDIDTAAPSATAEPAAAKPARPARKSRAAGASRKRAKAGRQPAARPAGAENGARERQVIELVGANPGITVAELAKGLDVEGATLYRTVRKLTDDGTLSKRGRQLHPGS